MEKTHIRFSPRILARLGEELNQGADQSILELIKNAFDADATKCTIELSDTAASGGSIRVHDNGRGMDAAGIRDGWLVLGSSEKTPLKKTKLGRTPAGNKGLGRLAALRMGKVVSLASVKENNSRRLHSVRIDWELFDGANTVEDVKLEIKSEKNTKRQKGTWIELTDLKSALRSEDVKKLARAALLLTDPFGDKKSGFTVVLKAPEFSDVEKLVRQKYFDDADYHLQASVNSRGIAQANILDWKGEVLAACSHDELRADKQRFKCPPSTFDFWVFLLKTQEFLSARKARTADIRAWLSHFGGVHVYQDGVRVFPYGNPGDDWLQLNLARVRSPEERPSTNNSIGRISIENEGAYPLTQKTDRSGFIEDDAYNELTEFAKSSLDWMARWRLGRAEDRRRAQRKHAAEEPRKEEQNFETALKAAPEKLQRSLKEAFNFYAKTRDREADALRKEVQLYRTLSTAGIIAATFAHESHGNPIKVIELNVTSLKGRISRNVPADHRSKLLDPLAKIEKSVSALATLGSATLSLVNSRKRRVGRVDIHNCISGIYSLLTPFFKGRDADIALRLAPASPYIRGSEAAVESILANLIDNSLRAFRRDSTENRLIQISTEIKESICEIRVADSGPGIRDVKPSDVWLPGVTTEPEGTGLGLTIVRDTVSDLGGSIYLLSGGELGGAEFVINLPILGA